MSSTTPTTSGIYCITCTVTGKFYVGSAVNLYRRWIDHRKHLRNNTHDNQKLQRAWNKYTEATFVFEILELVLIPEMLTAREQYWIDKLKPFFNIAKVAGSSLGIKRSPEMREKLSILKRGKPGPKHTPETRAILSAQKQGNTYNLGKKFTAEHRAKICAASLGNKSNLGRKRSPAAIEKTRLANLGQKRSEETVEKLRLSHLGQKHSPEAREKMSLTRRGRIHSPEARAKMSASANAVSIKRMKTIIVTSPDGVEQTITGIRKFCREHSLDSSALMKVAKGIYPHHKGWKARFFETDVS